MKKVTLSGKQKCGLGFTWLVAGIFGLMLAGCGEPEGTAPMTIAEAPGALIWEYAIGDTVLHKSGVLGVVIDMHFDALSNRNFGRYAKREGQWDGKKMQCYYIRVPHEEGLTAEWVSVLELEDAPDG